MSIRYLPMALTRRKTKLLLLVVLAVGLTIYCLAESQGISRRMPHYTQRPAPIANSTHSRTAQLENAAANKEDYAKSFITANSNDNYGNQKWHLVSAYEVEDVTTKCGQRYPQEARTDFNTFEMYKNDISTPGGGSRMRRRRKSDKGPLKVFLLPMTHVDPGWLETFDSYVGDTNRILDNMFAFLKTHPRMRFMWCEMVFFERWWSGLNNTQKAVVKQFVASGQLEMASGSWVMTDEANPFFPVTIDNIVEGQQFIFHQLGAKARTIWSNDPFGYGSSVPYLFTKTGVKWAVINRIHHRLKNFLQNFRAVPFKWRQYFDVEGDSDVYTHVLPYAHYDILNSCGPTPSVCCEFDFKRLTHHMCPQKKPVIVTQKNVADRAALLEEQLNKLSDLYQSNVVLVMWGDDFRYNSIEEWHQQYDNLAPIFDHINAANRTQIRFGTFVDYFTSLEKSNQEESSYPFTLSGDFFPYQCALGDLWTGYYTTRPFYKKQERQLHALIRAADLTTASVVKRLSEPERKWIFDNLSAARRNLSLFQHHDAITGTSKKHVMSNYAQLLFDSMKKSAACIAKAISTSHEVDFEINEMPLQYNQITSKKPIVIEPGNTVSVAVYNSVERKRLETIVLVVSTYKVSVMQEGKLVKAQIEPFVDSVTGRLSSLFSLVFHAMLPPLSTKIFTIVSDEQHSETDIAEVLFVADIQKDAKVHSNDFANIFDVRLVPSEQFFIETDGMRTTHSLENGLIKSVKTRSMGSMKFVQTIDQYVSSGGGPYIMHQTGPSQTFNLSGLSRFVIRGQMQQTLCIHSERLLQRTVVRNVPDIEGEQLHISLRVDIRGLAQVELITRFSTGLHQNSTEFYTDSNGLQLLKREYNEALPLKANYYPMPTALMLQDGSHRISIISDVEHGVTLYSRNTPEIMLDRILLHDDGKGLGSDEDSILNDVLPVEIGFTVVFERIREVDRPKYFAYHTPLAHMAVQNLLYKPIVLSNKGDSPKIPALSLVSFPCDLQLLTCRPILSSLDHRLLILHRPGTDCSSKEYVLCPSIDFTSAVRKYLSWIGVGEVTKTTLNGIDTIVAETKVNQMHFDIEPMDFAAFIVTFA